MRFYAWRRTSISRTASSSADDCCRGTFAPTRRRPIRVMHRLIFLSAGGVPLPAVGCFVAWPEFVACSTALRPCDTRPYPAALMGFALRSVAPARGTEAFSPRTPTCRFADDPPRSFFPGDRRRCSVELWRRPRTFAAAPGFCPRGQSVPPTPCGISAAETAVGFFLSQVCGSPDSGAPAHHRAGRQPQCPASGAYPLVGLGRIIPGVRRDHTVAARAAPRTRTME